MAHDNDTANDDRANDGQAGDGHADDGQALEIASWRGRNGESGAQVRRRRPNSWTSAHQNEFIAHLVATANVTASAAAVGKSIACVYARRRSSVAFRNAWADALAEGYARLEATLLDRALNGKRTTRTVGGVEVPHVEYSDNLGLHLLRQHRQAVAEHRAAMPAAREDPRVARARLARTIDLIVAKLPDRPDATQALIEQSDAASDDTAPGGAATDNATTGDTATGDGA